MWTGDARLIILTRSIRSFSDGFVSVVLASYLAAIGFSALRVGAIATATLLGSAVATLAAGAITNRAGRRRVLSVACIVAIATGAAFSSLQDFWPLILVAFVGTLNPSASDVSVFLPVEQAALPETVAAEHRTRLFARYNLAGALAAATGALFAATPAALHALFDLDETVAERSLFGLYAALAAVNLLLYRRLSPAIELSPHADAGPLRRSRGIVLRLAALFAVDAFAGGFVVQSILALWLFERFGVSTAQAGAIFFAAGVCASFSMLAAGRVAERFGLINTMVFTHLPSNVLLILVALMPTLWLALALLLARFALSQMDVPTRQSYTMAVVDPGERAAAASVTGVSRSLASAGSPIMAGALLGATTFGWPLIIAGSLKSVYDLLLLRQFRGLKPAEEIVRAR